jgi:hypothetical protein
MNAVIADASSDALKSVISDVIESIMTGRPQGFVIFALIAGAIFGVVWVIHATSITIQDRWAERQGERKVTARRQETVEAAPTPGLRDNISLASASLKSNYAKCG